MSTEDFDADLWDVEHFLRVYNAYKSAGFSDEDALDLAGQALDSRPEATP